MNIFSCCGLILFVLIIISILMTMGAVFLEYFGLTREFRDWVRSKFIKEKKDE